MNNVNDTNEGVAEGSENNNVTAQKIFFARSNKAPKGWSYDHVGFMTQDGKQIQMSGHKGNDVYVTNDVTDDPEFPKQNIKIVSLSKPVSVPTTNSVGAENCGTFVANVLQANGVKGIDTQKIYSVFKKPQEQGVAEGAELKQAKRKYNQAAKDANADQVGAGKKIDTMKKSLRQKDLNKQGVIESNDSEDLANEVYTEFERIYPNLARKANERTVHAAIMDVLNYGGDSNPSALAQDVARAVKQEMHQGVAEAGNKPLEKSRFGMGDTRTPRDIKSQMSGASDEFVRSTADKTTGPFHSRVAKMQGKMAKSELRKREQGVAEGSEQQWVVTVGTKTGGTSHTMTFSGTKEQAIKKAVARFGTSKNPVVTAKPKQQGVAEAQTDYQKRRQRERDVDAGKPVKPEPKNPQNDYFARRKKEKDLNEEIEIRLIEMRMNGYEL
jgi:hypothetical protein